MLETKTNFLRFISGKHNQAMGKAGSRHPDATDLKRDNSPRESCRQGHPDARDILTPKASNFHALLFSFFSLFRATPRLRFFCQPINVQLL